MMKLSILLDHLSTFQLRMILKRQKQDLKQRHDANRSGHSPCLFDDPAVSHPAVSLEAFIRPVASLATCIERCRKTVHLPILLRSRPETLMIQSDICRY